jgi:anti-anti-sigma factor
MKLTLISRDGPTVRLACEGALTLIPVAGQRALLEDVLGPDSFAGTALLDLSRVGYIDSTGVSWLIVAHKSFHERGGRLVIHSLTPLVQRVLDVMRLSAVLHLAANEEAARALLEVAGEAS